MGQKDNLVLTEQTEWMVSLEIMEKKGTRASEDPQDVMG